jgi:protein-disulfide isomerase
MNSRPGRLKSALEVVTSLAVLAAAAVLIVSRLAEDKATRKPRVIPLPAATLSLEGASSKGASTAPVVLVEFTDFECPYCGRFARDLFPALVREYVDTGKVQVAVRHLPLQMHPLALGAGAAAECARRQGRFWEMHDELFREGVTRDESTLKTLAQTLGLDLSEFNRCMSGEGKAAASADAQLAETLGVTGTPSFFVGRRLADGRVRVVTTLSGAAPILEFRTALDRALNDDTDWAGVGIIATLVGLVAIVCVVVWRRWPARTRTADAQ